MKKTLLTILCVLTAFCAMAQSEKTYTEPLVVTINGLSTPPQDASVAVIDNGDGTINFELKNFLLGAGEECMPVGNITIENLPVTKGEDGLDYISYSGNIFIQPGDMVGLSEEDWLGPVISSLNRDENGNPIGIPVVLQGKMNDEKLFVTIDIDMQSEIIYVQLGTDDFFGVVIGDLNGDTKVDIADAVTVLNIMAAGEYSKAADINNDEKIDIADFVSILNIMAEM